MEIGPVIDCKPTFSDFHTWLYVHEGIVGVPKNVWTKVGRDFVTPKQGKDIF
jgi:hypothetical protein